MTYNQWRALSFIAATCVWILVDDLVGGIFFGAGLVVGAVMVDAGFL